RVSVRATRAAQELALRAAAVVDAIGGLGVELFLLDDDHVMINELAPRPHNSGHYTIEACATSQFENHLRGVLGWPRGPSRLLGAAAMVNRLGSGANARRGLEQ